jgi:phosphonate transport system substrate-binding protein
MIEDVAPTDALAAVKVWARAIGRLAGWESADGVILPSADAALHAVNSGNTDFVALPTIEYLTIERSLAADPCLTYMAYGEVEVEYVLLTHRDTRSLQELRGKKVAVFSPTGVRNLPETWLDVLLLESGLPEKERTFQQVRPVKKASQAILPLFFKQVDAAVVTRSAFATAVELNPQLGADIVVLTQSQRLLPGLICVRRALDQQVRRRWLEGAVKLHQNAESRQTFMVLKVNRLMAWEPRYLDNARDLVNRYVHLKGAVGSQ